MNTRLSLPLGLPRRRPDPVMIPLVCLARAPLVAEAPRPLGAPARAPRLRPIPLFPRLELNPFSCPSVVRRSPASPTLQRMAAAAPPSARPVPSLLPPSSAPLTPFLRQLALLPLATHAAPHA